MEQVVADVSAVVPPQPLVIDLTAVVKKVARKRAAAGDDGPKQRSRSNKPAAVHAPPPAAAPLEPGVNLSLPVFDTRSEWTSVFEKIKPTFGIELARGQPITCKTIDTSPLVLQVPAGAPISAIKEAVQKIHAYVSSASFNEQGVTVVLGKGETEVGVDDLCF